jgi:RHS repeat-associated protein
MPSTLTIQLGGDEKMPFRLTGKEKDDETGFTNFGARLLDPKTSRWLSVDPAMGEYIPQAPVNDEARKYNQNLPGLGGIFNLVNANPYHYAGNSPVKYVDLDGNFDSLSPDGSIIYDFPLTGGGGGGFNGLDIGLGLLGLGMGLAIIQSENNKAEGNNQASSTNENAQDNAAAVSPAPQEPNKNKDNKNRSWKFGEHHSKQQWFNRMERGGWTEQRINEAINSGDSFSAYNNVNPGNSATRYIHPETGNSVVIDDVTNEILHLGGPGFGY